MADIGEKSYLMSGAAKETTAQEILEAVGNVAQQEDVDEILTKLNSGMGVVRHIQRGASSMAYNVGEVTITLNGFTDVNKMFVLINGNRPHKSSAYPYVSGDTYLSSLTTTALTIKTAGIAGDSISTAQGCNFSYQVIELY